MKIAKLFNLIVSAAISLSSAHVFAAMALSDQKISITNPVNGADLDALRDWSKRSDESITAVCAETTDVSGTFVCAFKKLSEMNDALLRNGFFNGTANGYPAGTLISNRDPELAKFKSVVVGHTVMGKDLENFYQMATASGERDKQLNSLEADFYSNIIHNTKVENLKLQYTVIAFSNESYNYKTVLRHEINHARFYLWPKYKQVSADFWQNDVTPQDKKAITLALSDIYNTSDLKIIVDECQAYILEGANDDGPFNDLVRKYQPILLERLRAAGINF